MQTELIHEHEEIDDNGDRENILVQRISQGSAELFRVEVTHHFAFSEKMRVRCGILLDRAEFENMLRDMNNYMKELK
ncbi:hypothetical protein SAMN02745671_01006 [Anaerovibrio lipolyticus DSM 3074]|uniref:Uncharacterized protein n=1 Tax=Anaerovibrio lipolyticus DSM 3074 TaxID=1120997 RepID=A0A1M6C5C2_9FIRM|nr:hypothetical protein [Anaerovibrio lipolyticus]SHI56162.1 hypothetical protein SAMN02745671_01006 [Anaerovibrio lipolyticus DSM 3074]